MVRRIVAVVLLAGGLAACNQNDLPAAPASFSGLGDVKVLDARIVPSTDGSAQLGGATTGYVVARVELTNDTGADLLPQIANFYLTDRNNNRYQAHDSGSSVFAGISNSQDVLKKDEKRVYTVGFRASDPTVSGSIFYER